MRLLAAVVAKNGVGSSWRKTIGSREWSRVPESEKAFIRGVIVELMFSEPSERVALQLGLLMANMAKCVGVLHAGGGVGVVVVHVHTCLLVHVPTTTWHTYWSMAYPFAQVPPHTHPPSFPPHPLPTTHPPPSPSPPLSLSQV